ncbi:RNA polymerase sporulation-specific sigma factor [Pseudobutyrivibrio sp. ACV-2]|uniref:sigma-70 family RNA polymerase sigma factor n=1 Tax=Pseudobutyrivibrio sp. ACV-2 TaxID=1520801 RepID=UPI00089B7791|nr:sigma-70 family RNA polymerase sigma factor [Pseudobutyrivibrio sp. ACV-2]SEB02663.1 RNA polymerase sporulation-specific sigma factor [Pseudobutyrivibrio sp. ACV-2]
MEKTSNHDLRQDKRNRFLCQQIQHNNSLAANNLVRENEGLIKRLAMSVEVAYELDETHYSGIDIEDLIQEGRIAMLKAANEFDLDSDARFSTFAFIVMRNAMADLCRKSLNVYEKKMIDKGYTRIQLDAHPIDEDGVDVEETLTLDGRDPTGNTAVHWVMVRKLINRLVGLTPRQRRLLIFHYGIGFGDDRTLEETAEHFHLSQKFAEDIEADAIKELKRGMNDGKIL